MIKKKCHLNLKVYSKIYLLKQFNLHKVQLVHVNEVH